jgi:tRNA threonylcarbamoyl adenosine modification protein (Sua5/YciO/YrdC/YwlC family)
MTLMSTRYPTGTDEEREAAVAAAAKALRSGEVVVLPTDTVYGIAADAFEPAAVRRLLAAKGRGREMPPPVLINAPATVDALAIRIPDWARALFVEFWPGALTVVLHQQASLQWDLGETRGTVAVRVPDHPLAIEILGRTGPLAVSSANKTGLPAALDAEAAEQMLGNDVGIIVDGGTAPGGEASTIIDATGAQPRLLRLGAIPVERLDEVLAPHGVSVQGTIAGEATPDRAGDSTGDSAGDSKDS